MIRRPPAGWLAACGLLLSALTLAPPALAQPSQEARAAAAVLFEDGRRLMGEGRYAEACPKLEESQRIDPGMGTLYQVSVCYEATGRTASAWVGFRDVASMAFAAGQSEREKAARAKAAAIEPKLMRLKITVQPANTAAGVEVKRDGAVIHPALWGTPVPLDPGKHRVSASAPGKEPWEVTVQLDQAGGVVNVDVPPLLERKGGPGPVTPPAPTGPAAPGPSGPPDAGPLPRPPEWTNPRPWQVPLGSALIAVGAGGMGLGVGLGVWAKTVFDNTNSSGNCDKTTNHCNPQGLSDRSDAVTKGNAGTGVFVAGAALAAGGIILIATAPRSGPKTGAMPALSIGLAPSLDGVPYRGPVGGSLRGEW